MKSPPSDTETPPPNSFGIGEFRGAVGDLGTMLPLAFLLVVSSGFPAARLFFLWGVAYVAVGWYYRVPVSIQPLKVMAVVAVTGGLTASFLSSTAVLYGGLLLVLSATGAVGWIQRWFSRSLVRGVQLGIGLMLAWKAWELITENAMYLDGSGPSGGWVLVLSAALIAGLGLSRKWLGRTVVLELVAAAIVLSLLAGVSFGTALPGGEPWEWHVPDWGPWWNMATLLIIPQLPLTLGNAVYAADDACREFWPDRSGRVSAPSLAGSIGTLNLLIGFAGGFPVCHGAGGIAAHRRFGGKTGGTVIILGMAFIMLALTQSLNTLLFLIPVPLLGVLLLFDSWQMITLMLRLDSGSQLAVALLVGLVSFGTHNLTLALIIGLFAEWLLGKRPRIPFFSREINSGYVSVKNQDSPKI